MLKKKDKKEFSKSNQGCMCKQVTLGEIVHAIQDQGARTLDDLERLTEAGGSCGCCKSPEDDFGEEKMELYLTQVLGKFIK